MDLKEKLMTPSEPVELKNQILNTREYFRSNLGTSIDVDSMAVWFGNAIPKYVWGEWKVPLRGIGITWPKFLKLMKYNTKFMIGWVSGKTKWTDFTQNMRKSIEDWIDPQIEMLAETSYKDAILASSGQMKDTPWVKLDEKAKKMYREQALKLLETIEGRR
jgi:hypothetical protein